MLEGKSAASGDYYYYFNIRNRVLLVKTKTVYAKIRKQIKMLRKDKKSLNRREPSLYATFVFMFLA